MTKEQQAVLSNFKEMLSVLTKLKQAENDLSQLEETYHGAYRF